MTEQASSPDIVKTTAAVEKLGLTESKSTVGVQPSRSKLKVHKSLLNFAIPLDQFSQIPLNKDHSIHVSVIIVNPTTKIPLLGPNGVVPTGPVILGVDKTLLKGVARVVKECTGLKLDAIKSHLGIYRHHLPTPSTSTSDAAPSSTPGPKPSASETFSPRSTSASASNLGEREREVNGEKAMVYSFLATIEPDVLTSADASSTGTDTEQRISKGTLKGEWKWCSKTEIESMNLPLDRQKLLLAVLKLVENNASETRVQIPPTRLIEPNFEVVKSLKAYLLPLKVFCALPPLGGKELIASVAVIHPIETKFLLVQRSSTDSWPNHWELPGGGSEPEDLTILHTAVREVKEETGLEVVRFKGLAGTFEIEKKGVVARVYVSLAKLGSGSSPNSTSSSTPSKPDTVRASGLGHEKHRAEVGVGEGEEIQVRLNPEEHQAYNWVGSREEVEVLKVPPGLKPVMMDLLDALNHTASRGQE